MLLTDKMDTPRKLSPGQIFIMAEHRNLIIVSVLNTFFSADTPNAKKSLIIYDSVQFQNLNVDSLSERNSKTYNNWLYNSWELNI